MHVLFPSWYTVPVSPGTRWRTLPCVGVVPAGPPRDVTPVLTEVDVPDCFGHGRDLVALQVMGDSMEPLGIRAGDLLIVQRHVSVRPGDIVVVATPEGWTVKQWQPHRYHVRLHAAHPDHADREWSLREITVWGVVIGIFRRDPHTVRIHRRP